MHRGECSEPVNSVGKLFGCTWTTEHPMAQNRREARAVRGRPPTGEDRAVRVTVGEAEGHGRIGRVGPEPIITSGGVEDRRRWSVSFNLIRKRISCTRTTQHGGMAQASPGPDFDIQLYAGNSIRGCRRAARL